MATPRTSGLSPETVLGASCAAAYRALPEEKPQEKKKKMVWGKLHHWPKERWLPAGQKGRIKPSLER